MSDAPAMCRSAVPWSSVMITITLGRATGPGRAGSSARVRTAALSMKTRINDHRSGMLIGDSPSSGMRAGTPDPRRPAVS